MRSFDSSEINIVKRYGKPHVEIDWRAWQVKSYEASLKLIKAWSDERLQFVEMIITLDQSGGCANGVHVRLRLLTNGAVSWYKIPHSCLATAETRRLRFLWIDYIHKEVLRLAVRGFYNLKFDHNKPLID